MSNKIFVFGCGCCLSECVKVDVRGLSMGSVLIKRFCPVHYDAAKKPYSRKNAFCKLLRIEMPCVVCGKLAKIKNQHADSRNVLALCEKHRHLRKELKNSRAQDEHHREAPLLQTANVNCIKCGRQTKASSPYGFSTKTPRVYCTKCRGAVGKIDDRFVYGGLYGAKLLGETAHD